MIRVILIGLLLFLFLVVFSPALLVLWIIGKFSPKTKQSASTHIVRGALRIAKFVAGIRLEVYGAENLLKDEPVLYVGNHRSFVDIVVSYLVIPGNCGFVAKKELWKVPFLRRWMQNIHCLFLDRQNIREGLKTILQGIEEVKTGTSMFIFTEGTRNHGEVMMPFKEGALKIAEKSGCPIIPFAMEGTSEIFEKHFPKVKKGVVRIYIGEPIRVKALSKEEKKFLGAYTRKKIEEMLPENYREA